MPIDKKQIRHIANLARIGFTAKELGKFQKEFSGILEFVGQLNEATTENVESISQITGLENVTREDGGERITEIEREALLDLIPEKQDRQVKVKAIL